MPLSRFVVAILVVVVVVPGVSATEENDYDYNDYMDHPCLRQCTDNESPRICKYRFIIENYYSMSRHCYECPLNLSHCFMPHCAPADGHQRDLMLANRKLPGPGIQVCQGDTIEVTVDNQMLDGEGTSIHWHGLLQRGTPYMDGTSQITQCDIQAHTKFTYRFKVVDPGTHFWHAHSGLQTADGLFGPLIVRSPPKREPHFHIYDLDLPEHVIVVNDWAVSTGLHEFMARYVGQEPSIATSILVNGMGGAREFKDASNTSVYTPKATFTVSPGRRYRFRVINAGIYSCGIRVSVDGHNLTVIATDGSPFEPFQLESFTVFQGERYDFIMHTKPTALGNYWIRFLGELTCWPNYVSQTAILKYVGAPDELPPETTTWADANRAGRKLTPWSEAGSDINVDVSTMRSVEPEDKELMTSEPNLKLFITSGFRLLDNPVYDNPVFATINLPYPGKHQSSYPMMGEIVFKYPSSPLLSQYNNTPQSDYCNVDTVKPECGTVVCECIHRYRLKLGSIVEIILLDLEKANTTGHPLHFHGHRFKVLAHGKNTSYTSIQDVKAFDKKGELTRTTTRAPFKDTIYISAGGYAIVRFRADNPGFWLFHCHLVFHAEKGKIMLFQVGEEWHLPPKPKDFPTCGDWSPSD